MKPTPRDVQRFHAKYRHGRPDECWEWLQGRDSHGYGQFWVNNHNWNAHKFAFFLKTGRLRGSYVCHTCDNRACVNPRHLYHGSPRQNCQDCHDRGRANPPAGERNPQAKLTNVEVRCIRQLASHVQGTELATRFNVSRALISLIINNKVRVQ